MFLRKRNLQSVLKISDLTYVFTPEEICFVLKILPRMIYTSESIGGIICKVWGAINSVTL